MFNINMKTYLADSESGKSFEELHELQYRARFLDRLSSTNTCREGGTTPLYYAVKRGDAEIVEILMQHGAKASVKNDLGRDVLSYCDAFPEIKGAIERVQRERNVWNISMIPNKPLRNPSQVMFPKQNLKYHQSQSSNFTLQRRVSTVTPVKYDMYLMSVSKVLNMFGNEGNRKQNMHLCHQDLLKDGDLTRFEDLPMGSFVMFVSHQWNGFNHPDPNGVQLRVLCSTLRRLRDGVYDNVRWIRFTSCIQREL